jgi:flagellum-specific peptidoglycan hydrolase FlgJ
MWTLETVLLAYKVNTKKYATDMMYNAKKNIMAQENNIRSCALCGFFIT